MTERKSMEAAFEKLPRETVKAFAAFKTYLELGPERTIGEVCKRLGKTRTVLDRWSQRYDWCNRALAYEAHMAKVEAEAARQSATAGRVVGEITFASGFKAVAIVRVGSWNCPTLLRLLRPARSI